jgi:PKHD-type hydroxylase
MSFQPHWIPRLLSRQECLALRSAACSEAFEAAEVSTGVGYQRRGAVAWIAPESGPAEVFERLDAVARRYARSIGFCVRGIEEPLQIARYHRGDHFDWHVDVGDEAPRRKITVVVQLSSARDYAGGDVEFCTLEPSALHRAIGSALVFPSILGHKVSPVSRGERLAAVAWLHGPPLR